MPSFHWWRTVFWLIPAISVYTIVLGALSLASMLVDRRGHVAHGCARAWSRLILVTTGVRVQSSGGDLVPAGGSYVFVSNHQSIYDFPILITSIPFQLRILAKASLGAFPVLGWHLRYTGHLLVDRARAGRATLNRVAVMIRRGHSLIVFPEGTRSRDGRVGRFKRGLFLLAIDAGIPVVPVALTGTRQVMRKGELTTRPGDVCIVLHEPLRTEGFTRADATRLAERARDIIAATVAEREGHAAEPPAGRGGDAAAEGKTACA
ncbi:MAG: 1-acyl-sn-glycerol-3-phosphate acyltransferase [Acidobacteria bacterium]|nr:1-acyl-sn-glycerol-3-phosphate acyltransferase [Acidobacteriota bacterium]